MQSPGFKLPHTQEKQQHDHESCDNLSWCVLLPFSRYTCKFRNIHITREIDGGTFTSTVTLLQLAAVIFET